MTMVVRLRQVGHDDTQRLVELLEQMGHPADAAAVHQRLDYWLNDPSSHLLGADHDGELVGVAAWHIAPMFDATGHFARLLSLVVHEQCRRQGVGRTLVAAMEDQARAAGCFMIELMSSRHRRDAHIFYNQLGYKDSCATRARFTKRWPSAT